MPTPLFRRLPFVAVSPLTVLAAAALLTLGAAGCSQKEETPSGNGTSPSTAPTTQTEASAAPITGTLKVSLITPGSIADKGWSQSAYEGMQKIKTGLSAETGQPVEKPALAQVEGVMRNFAQDGSNVIFAQGSEYDEAAKKIAPDLKTTTICVNGGRSLGGHLMPIQFQAGQATYLAGMLAAGMSKSGKIACVGPQEIPIIKASFAAFTKGAKAVKPDIDVMVTFIGDEDIAKGKQQAQALLEDGVDVIMHNANAAGQGVAQAVTEKDGAMFIGANDDQSSLATPKNLGSFILDTPNAMLAVAKNVKDGTNTGKAYEGGIKDKAVSFKFNPGFKGTIPDDLKKKMDAAEAEMASGKLKVD